jgi:hypothetical protein
MKYYRNSIDISTRLWLGLQIYLRTLAHGEVKRLAFEYQVSRWFLYVTCQGLVADFIKWSQQSPSSVPSFSFCQNLEEKVLCLYLEGESSLESIQQTLWALEGHQVSISWISKVLNQVGSQLPSSSSLPSGSSEEENMDSPVITALDEVFIQGLPVLAMVDPQSLWNHAIILKDHCCIEDWEEVRQKVWPEEGIEKFWGFSDGAQAIRHTVEKGGYGQWGLDPWHAYKPLREIRRRLEKEVEGWMQELPEKEKKRDQSQSGMAKRTAEELLDITWECLGNSWNCIEQWDILMKWLKESLWWIDPHQGVIQTKQQAQEDSQVILELMKELLDDEQQKKLEFFSNHLEELLVYFDLIPAVEKRLKQLVPDRFEREVLLIIYHHYHFSFQAQGTHLKQLKQEYLDWQSALKVHWGEEIWEVRWKQVLALFSGVVRASSYVENLNSRLRRFFDSARGEINQNRLNLIRFYLNHKHFRRGKRQGNSPASLKEETSTGHWLQSLREALENNLIPLVD